MPPLSSTSEGFFQNNGANNASKNLKSSYNNSSFLPKLENQGLNNGLNVKNGFGRQIVPVTLPDANMNNNSNNNQIHMNQGPGLDDSAAEDQSAASRNDTHSGQLFYDENSNLIDVNNLNHINAEGVVNHESGLNQNVSDENSTNILTQNNSGAGPSVTVNHNNNHRSQSLSQQNQIQQSNSNSGSNQPHHGPRSTRGGRSKSLQSLQGGTTPNQESQVESPSAPGPIPQQQTQQQQMQTNHNHNDNPTHRMSQTSFGFSPQVSIVPFNHRVESTGLPQQVFQQVKVQQQPNFSQTISGAGGFFHNSSDVNINHMNQNHATSLNSKSDRHRSHHNNNQHHQCHGLNHHAQTNNSNLTKEDENFLVSDNLRLRKELETLQVSLLQSLKRQDRFISGGQFKGPPMKSGKNSMSQTHQGGGGFLNNNGSNGTNLSALDGAAGKSVKGPNRGESSFHQSELKRYKSKEKELTKEIVALRKQVEADALMRKRCRLLEDESRILKNQVVSLQEDHVSANDNMQSMYERQIANLKQKNDEYAVREKSLTKDLQEQLNSKMKEKEDISQELNEVNQRLNGLEQERLELQDSALKRNMEMASAMKNLDEMQQKGLEQDDTIEQLNRRISDGQWQQKQLENQLAREIEDKKASLKTNEADLRRHYEQKIADLMDRIGVLETQIVMLEKQMGDERDKNEQSRLSLNEQQGEWEKEKAILEHRYKVEIKSTEQRLQGEKAVIKEELSQKVKDVEVRASKKEDDLKKEIGDLQAENKAKVKQMYDMAIMQFLASAQRKNDAKIPDPKVIFTLWRAETQKGNAIRRENEAKQEVSRKLEQENAKFDKERDKIRMDNEVERSRQSKVERLREEERQKMAKKELNEAVSKEREKLNKEQMYTEKKYISEIKDLKEKNKSLEGLLEQLEGKYDQLEKHALQKKLQQLMKLQVLAPRVSVTINGDTFNAIDVEVAPSTQELKDIMAKEVLPRFVKVVVSEDFDESVTQSRVQEVMSSMVNIIEEKLQGIFGSNCLRSTSIQ